jgi:nucleoside-diphosphate-sugar epimerase
MQTVLGSGGAIGIELAKALKKYTNDIRLVSRLPQKVNESDQLMAADLLKESDVYKAIKGSEIAYVTVGFSYSVKAWKRSWPKFIKHVIGACEKYNCKLVFFDNIYMYDPKYLNGMTEDTPINPSSGKGKVRDKIAKMIMDAVDKGKLTALIARSADFYGPSIQNNSMLTETVFKPLSNGKKANWMSSANYKHSFTYVPDAAEATALLGNTDEAYNQVWHLPTASNPYTGKEWIEQIAKEMGAKPKIQVAPKFLVRIMGIFIPIMREMVEMMYQYDRDYVFDSSKFEKQFNYKPTSYEAGIKEIIKADYSN